MILTQNAIEYTIGRIADIAFPQMEYRVESGSVPMLCVDSGIIIKFIRPEESNVELLFSGNASFSNYKSYDGKVELKLFSLSENRLPFSLVGNAVCVNFDMITVSYLLLSRAEETLVDKRDKYGRFCYADSICCKYELVDIPIVDEYAMLLRKFVAESFPNFSINKRVSKFVPTHDIDFLFRFPNFAKAVKTIAGDLFKRKSLRVSCRSFASYLKSLYDFKQDPYVWTTLELIKASKEKNLKSYLYFKALGKRENDCTYNILSPKSRKCIDFLLSQGVTIGLHGGLYSFADKIIFTMEKSRLETVCGREVTDVRQHFLRFDTLKTPQVWQECGIRHDCTLGFPEREGFRCGTCHPYPLFDVANNVVTGIIEHPLVVMDTTLFQYRELVEGEAFESICNLYERCKSVEGDFVVLWHNTTMFGSLESWYRNVYLRFLKSL